MKNQTNKRKDAKIFYSIMISFPILWFLIFYVAVNVNSILLSFKNYDINTGAITFVGFENFISFGRDFFGGVELRAAIRNSTSLFLGTVLIGMSLAVIFSYYVYKKFIGEGAFKVLLFVPTVIPSIALVIMYSYFVDRALPVAMESIFGIKMLGLLTDAKTQWGAIFAFNIIMGFGPNVLMYLSAMSRIPEDIIEYGQIDGLNYVKEFIFIVFPLVSSTIATFFVVNIAAFFTSQGNIFSFFSERAENRLYTIGYYLFIKVQGKNSITNYPYASAGGLILTLIAAPITLIARWLLNKITPQVEF